MRPGPRSADLAQVAHPAGPDLAVLAHRLTSALNRALRIALDDDDSRIGPRHRAVFVCLRPAGSRAVDVARESGQHKQVVGTLVDELEKAGYVRREPDPVDRRGKLIVPTEAGTLHMARTNAVLAAIEADLAAEVGHRRYDEFKRACERVVDTLTPDSNQHRTAGRTPT
jgi:DNA-binding MarR family transcriptional regulator